MNRTEYVNSTSVLETIVTNATFNYTQDYIYQISSVSHVLNIIISVLTVFLNCCMIKCLQANRSKIQKVIFLQLMSLSVSDALAGFSPALSCLTLIDVLNRNVIACIFILFPFNASQCAVLMNLCVLSFRRWIILRKVDQPSARTEPSLLRTILYTLCPWLVSFLFHIALFLGGANQNSSVNGCLSPELIRNEKVLNMVGVLYFVMLVLVNAFNIFSAVTLTRFKQPNTSCFYSNRLSLYRRAFRQLLTVMGVVNLTTIPVIIISVMVAVQGMDDRKPEQMYIAMHFQTLNSLINPLVYSVHVNEVRASIKENIFACLGRNRNEESRGNLENCLHVAAVAKGHDSSVDNKHEPEMESGF